MDDKFLSALEDVCDAVGAGETIEAAVEAAAEEHGHPVQALMNRAVSKIGDLGQCRKAAEELRIRERIKAMGRRDWFNRTVDGEMGIYSDRHALRERGHDIHERLEKRQEWLEARKADRTDGEK